MKPASGNIDLYHSANDTSITTTTTIIITVIVRAEAATGAHSYYDDRQ
jgi:hypothetical protein